MRTQTKLEKMAKVLPLASMALLTVGWTNALYPSATSAQESQHLVRKFDEAARNSSEFDVLHLDLADSQDWGFVMGRLRAAGKSPKNSPELFKRLDFMRQRALARKAGFQTSTTSAETWCNHYFKWSESAPITSNGITTFYPAARASCKDGATYVFLDVTNVNENEAGTESTLINTDAVEEYGGGLEMQISTQASLPADQNRVLRTESLLIAVGDAVDQTSLFVQRAAAIEKAPSFSFSHPRKIHTNYTRPEIIACQMRGGSDCDYAVAGYSGTTLVAYPPRPTGIAAANPNQSTLNPSDYWAFSAPYDYNKLYTPVRGMLSAGTSGLLQCTFSSFDRARIQLIATQTGRTCFNTATLLSALTTGRNTASLNTLADMSNLFNQAGNGTSPASCATTTILNELTKYDIFISGTMNCNGTTKRFVATYPTTQDLINARTSSIYFWNSCMAEGTSVKLADGSVVPVEQVKNGDQVVADAQGNLLTVTDVARGNEYKPLFRLKDDAGHDVTLTEMHPVIKASGEVVATKALKVKDQVKTDKGVATLTSIERVAPEGKRVYNLRLGTEQELLKVGKNGRTLFAGGFLVGDLSMQDELQAPKKQDPVAALQRLPKAWHQDFQRRVVKQ